MDVLILAGGVGTRLWPLSTKNEPKQFLKLFEDQTLLQATIDRALVFTKQDKIFIAATLEQKEQVMDHVSDRKIPREHLFFEPAGKNTAPAIGFGLKSILERYPDKLNTPFFICPSDHWIQEDPAKLMTLIEEAERIASQGRIVAFGIPPLYAETGYGYIQIDPESSKILQFKEKPDLVTARYYVESGNYLWNSGIFTMTPKVFFDALKEHTPDLATFFSLSLEEVVSSFHNLPAISFDVAVMEKETSAFAVPFPLGWSDIGSWESIYRSFTKDEQGNVIQGIGNLKESTRCLLFSESIPIVAMGVSDLLMVQTEDAILVAPRRLSEAMMRSSGEKIGTKTVYRSWGSFTVLSKGRKSLTKKIRVHPKCRLDLQYHYHRDEHWVVTKGVAEVTLGEKTVCYHENQSVFIPRGTAHCLANPGEADLEVIEVQYGERLSEEDVVRVEDDLGRIKDENCVRL